MIAAEDFQYEYFSKVSPHKVEWLWYKETKMIVFCQHKRRTDESSFQKIICSPKLFPYSELR